MVLRIVAILWVLWTVFDTLVALSWHFRSSDFFALLSQSTFTKKDQQKLNMCKYADLKILIFSRNLATQG